MALALALGAPFSAFGNDASPQNPLSGNAPLYMEGSSGEEAAHVPLNSLAPLVKRVKPGVVNIYTISVVNVRPRRPGPFFFDPLDDSIFGNLWSGPGSMETRQSLGSGFILNAQGLVVTNNHVVDGAAEIRVKLDDGREFSARPVGTDPKTDLALLSLVGDDVTDLPVVPLGDSDALEVGDFALAVGNPFGLDHSVSLGIVSAKERVIGAGPYDDFIQTDTAINPGNSGGPLFNLKGEVVGVNTAIMASGQGIGFAVPVNMLKTLLPQLIRGQVFRGWLGVSVQEVPAGLGKRLNLKKPMGALVMGVIRNGPAFEAGIRAGDIIQKVGDRPIQSYNQFSRVVASLAPDTKVKITVLRDGESRTLEARIALRPDERPRMRRMQQMGAMGNGQNGAFPAPGSQNGTQIQEGEESAVASTPADGDAEDEVDLGIAVREISRATRQRLGISQGVEVTSVDANGPLAKGGVQPGDVILEIQRKRIRNLGDFATVAGQLRKGQRALIRLQRGDTSVYVAAML